MQHLNNYIYGGIFKIFVGKLQLFVFPTAWNGKWENNIPNSVNELLEG